MGKKVPSIDEAFDQPSPQPVGRRIAKNLHLAIPAVVLAALAVVIAFDAAEEGEQLEERKKAKAEQEIAQMTQVTDTAPAKVLADEIARQKEAVAAAPAQLRAPAVPTLDDPLPQGQNAGATVGGALPPVPAGRPQIAADQEAAKREQVRLEQMRASPVIKLQGNGGAGVASALPSAGAIMHSAATGVGASPEQRLATMRAEAERMRASAQQQADSIIKLGKSNLAQARSGERPMVVSAGRAGSDDQWYSQVAAQSGAVRESVVLEAPQRMPVVHQGTIIPAVLVTELNSDLPGQISAMVTMDVYDSVRGDYLMIPKGSRLVGQYNSDLRIGQERAMAAFTRIIRPDGSSMNLGAMPGADGGGQAGLSDQVDSHFWKMFSSSFLIAGISFLADASAPDTVVVNSSTQSPQASAGEILKDISRTILERDTSIPPTVIVRKGHRFNVLVNKDITVTPMH